MRRWPWIIAAVAVIAIAVVAFVVVGTGRDRVVAGTGSKIGAQDFARIEKGRYLAIAADCAGCHTNPENGQPLAGGRPIETPFGTVLSSNITPDRETGIGAWSDAEFETALRHGRARSGAHLYPAMPYPYYTELAKDDVLSLRAYLNTVRPVHQPVHANQLPFPFNIRASMAIWNALYFKSGEFKYDPNKSAVWNRGAYLVNGAGHCAACHTAKNFLGGDEASRFLRGGLVQSWFAPDITDDNAHGVGTWTVGDIVAYLKSGHNRMTAATGTMSEEIELSTSHLSDPDLTAMAVYLKDLNHNVQTSTPIAMSDNRMKAGAAIYGDLCSSCHAPTGQGAPKLFPSLARSSNVRSLDPTSLIRIVLRGARSAATVSEPTAPGMPSFGWQLNDQEVADVLTYIRNSWGAAAPPVTSSDVKRLRASLASRND
jgi:mono/diheme cytochrome c family protein